MPNMFDVLAPIFRAPFSGDVTQEITPNFLSSNIKGSPAIESKVITNVASYGKQLGKILDALQHLSASTGTAMPEIDLLVREIDKVKERSRDELREEAEAALARLRKADEDAWRDLTGQ